MMGVSAADAYSMSMHEYEMRLWHWNEIHGDNDGIDVDPAVTERLIEGLKDRPDLLTVTKKSKVPA